MVNAAIEGMFTRSFDLHCAVTQIVSEAGYESTDSDFVPVLPWKALLFPCRARKSLYVLVTTQLVGRYDRDCTFLKRVIPFSSSIMSVLCLLVALMGDRVMFLGFPCC